MASKLFMFCIFAIVLLAFVLADDYEGGEGGEGEGETEESYDNGDGGGDGGGESQGEGGGEGESEDSGEDSDGGEESEESAAASQPSLAQLINPMLNRKKRSLNIDDSKRVLSRVRRGGYGRVGPVYTYQKTDYHGNFKWGVRHNVGGGYGHGK